MFCSECDSNNINCLRCDIGYNLNEANTDCIQDQTFDLSDIQIISKSFKKQMYFFLYVYILADKLLLVLVSSYSYHCWINYCLHFPGDNKCALLYCPLQMLK